MSDIAVNKVINAKGHPIEVTTVSGDSIYVTPATTAGDAFGRLRVSNPYTLFDSSHRYHDNGLWATSTGVSGAATFNANQGLVDMTLGTTSGDFVLRETYKVFPYQPGKSLLTMNTFVMESGQENQRQRVGYFSSGNGIFIEQSGVASPAIVKRSSVSGSVVDTRIEQGDWNVDALQGSGESGYTLDLTKAQIFWSDLEWLGAGTVRAGFVIDGQFVHCHSFHHANEIESTYMTTASLPCRYEIENLNTVSVSGTLKQICSTVLSEGGYQLIGEPHSVATPVTSPYSLTSSGVNYPVASIKLKSTDTDAVVIPVGINILGTTNNSNYRWSVVKNGTTSGGTWSDLSSTSFVQYNLSGTSFSGGNVLAQGYVIGSNQGSTATAVDRTNLFKFQLEREPFTSTSYELTVVVSVDSGSSDVVAAIDWEEV
tara:strand:- start:4738 stop:6018 length:1281 start_codon:yes stop_codon:yes gene_type:complete